jgi:hypothetical protein
MHGKAARAAAVSMFLFAGSAMAQESSEVPDATESPPASQRVSRGRFRFGINGAVGIEDVASVSGTMYGLDVRLGWQINDRFAIYAQPHLSFGTLGTSVGGVGVSGSTGTFVNTVMGEMTFSDRFFGGVGVGYGVLNNPSGIAFEARVGGYPLMGLKGNGPRRRGLMVGMNLKTVSITGATGILVMGNVGYEAF